MEIPECACIFYYLTLQAFQLRSFGIFPFLDSNMITAAVTFTTIAGGLPNDFSSVRLLCKFKIIGNTKLMRKFMRFIFTFSDVTTYVHCKKLSHVFPVGKCIYCLKIECEKCRIF